MAKRTSYFGGPKSPNLGANPSIPKKKIPYDISDVDFNLVMTEKQKQEDSQRIIKDMVYHYERIGRQQLSSYREEILKQFNLAYGVIDKSDYIKGESEHKAEIDFLGGESLDFDLEFYPIIPNIVNTLTNFLSKTKIGYSAIALNREAQNEVIEAKNNDIRNLLIGKAQEMFNAQMMAQGITPEANSEVYAQQVEIFKALPKIQRYYSTEFRLSVEKWAAHRLKKDDHVHNMIDLEKKMFFNKLVCDRPFIHVNLLDDNYRPEILRPENCFFLRSPHVEDVSEGVMFGWYTYESAVNIINQEGHRLTEDDVKTLQKFYLSTRFTQFTSDKYDTNVPDDLANAQNYHAFQTEFRDKGDIKHRGDEYKDHLVEVMNMYFQLPRKLYKLTMKVGTEDYTTVVDEDYKVSIKPIYTKGKPRTTENLEYGEHLDPFYINELWRCKKINLNRNPNPELSDDIWVSLERYPIQISDPKISRYGSLIPVHGGPKTNEYSSTVSIVAKCRPWQVFYNYLWNRNNQILQSELGVFLMLNQNVIPQESMGEQWGLNNLVKWALTGRDTGIAPTDFSLNNLGQSAVGATNGYGQKMDLTRTEEVLQKAKLAEICKQECLSIVGVSPQLLGDISPNETATGIVQGIHKSISQLKHLYDEHYSTMTKARQTMLEVAKYLAASNKLTDETYLNSEEERVIFQVDTTEFPLYQLGVFVTSNFDDNILREEIRQLALRDNTMGADALDKVQILSASSITDIMSKLKDSQVARQKQQQDQQQQMNQIEQQRIEAMQKQADDRMAWERERLAAMLESNEAIAEMRMIGATEFAQGDGLDTLIKYKQAELKENSYYMDIMNKAKNRSLQEEQMLQAQGNREKEADVKVQLKREELQVKREAIMAKLKDSENKVKIAIENKP